tara:strand:- start:719 stop:1063 length:345 start_codon:yes stop_codon:yes gene_type:complete
MKQRFFSPTRELEEVCIILEQEPTKNDYKKIHRIELNFLWDILDDFKDMERELEKLKDVIEDYQNILKSTIPYIKFSSLDDSKHTDKKENLLNRIDKKLNHLSVLNRINKQLNQ